MPHRCSFDQISIDAAMGSAVSRASATPFLPDAGTTTCSNSGSYFSCIASHSASAYSVRRRCARSAAAGPAIPSGLAPVGSLPRATSTSRHLALLRAHWVGIDVGRQDLSILL